MTDAVPAVRTQQLTKRYGAVAAVDQLDLEVRPGEVMGYLGPNGAGKTTTIRMLLNLSRPSAGRAEIFGLDCEARPIDVHRRVAYVGGEPNLWPSMTGAESLHLLGRVHGSVDEPYRDELIERFELDPSRKVRTYSKGNRQKVVVIAALMTRADLLLLDEPTGGLDPLMEQVFRACVAEAKDQGQTVFLSSHILNEVEALCDRVAILRGGRLVEIGSLSEMRHLSAVTVEITFAGAAPDLSSVPGVRVLDADDRVVRLQVLGSMQPLVAELASAPVTQLLSREPSLEELFLARYGESGSSGAS